MQQRVTGAQPEREVEVFMPGKMPTNALPYFILAVAAVTTLAIFGAYFYLAGGVGIYSDGIGYYAPLRSIVFDGNLQVVV